MREIPEASEAQPVHPASQAAWYVGLVLFVERYDTYSRDSWYLCIPGTRYKVGFTDSCGDTEKTKVVANESRYIQQQYVCK